MEKKEIDNEAKKRQQTIMGKREIDNNEKKGNRL